MLSAALTRALTTPAFVAADFVPTHWDSAEQKAKFANALLTFVAQDFPRSKFHESFYRRLSNTFGHIAHYAERAVMRSNTSAATSPLNYDCCWSERCSA